MELSLVRRTQWPSDVCRTSAAVFLLQPEVSLTWILIEWRSSFEDEASIKNQTLSSSWESSLCFRVRKILNLRLFEDESGRSWSRSVMDGNLEVLCVSQFTLQCVLKGNKPDFHCAMPAELAQPFYNSILEDMRSAYKPELVKGGRGFRKRLEGVTREPLALQAERRCGDAGTGNWVSAQGSKCGERLVPAIWSFLITPPVLHPPPERWCDEFALLHFILFRRWDKTSCLSQRWSVEEHCSPGFISIFPLEETCCKNDETFFQWGYLIEDSHTLK